MEMGEAANGLHVHVLAYILEKGFRYPVLPNIYSCKPVFLYKSKQPLSGQF